MINYALYDTQINTVDDLKKYKTLFENDLEEQKRKIDEFVERANKRIEWVKECENNKNFRILGNTFRNGKNKEILLIIRYPDGSQRDERYSFSKITELRSKMSELQEKYSGVSWDEFIYEIK